MINASVTGMQKVVVRMSRARDLRFALASATLRLAIEAQRKVKDEKLAGQVLKVHSGRLRRSINVRTIEDAGMVGASTGTNVIYGRYWELGFTGVQSVRGFTREKASNNVNQVVRGPGGKLKRMRVASGVTFVGAHTREVNQPARPFLSAVLGEMRDQARADLILAARTVLEGA